MLEQKIYRKMNGSSIAHSIARCYGALAGLLPVWGLRSGIAPKGPGAEVRECVAVAGVVRTAGLVGARVRFAETGVQL